MAPREVKTRKGNSGQQAVKWYENIPLQSSSMYSYLLGNIGILYEVHEDIRTVRIKVIEAKGFAYK